MVTNPTRLAFCQTCGAALSPGDDWSRECHVCTDDVIDNDEPPDEDYPEFDWRNSSYVRNVGPV